MQTVSRYLLDNVVIVYSSGYHGRNPMVYDRRLKLYKGVSNPLNFTFKNEDQKAQDISSSKFEFTLIDPENQRSAIFKDLTVLNTVQATAAVVDDGDGSTAATTTTITISNSNITGNFIIGHQVKGTTLQGPVVISNVAKSFVTGNTILTVTFDLQVLPQETVAITAGPKGSANLVITEGDLLGLDAKFYNYAIREVDTDDSTLRTVTFSDASYNAAGTIEVLDGAYPGFVPSIEINSFTVTTGPLTNTSSAIDADPGINNNVALHTVAMYQKSFVGTLRIQGTMVSSPDDADYFDIANISFDNNSDPVRHHNFTGVYDNVRFSWGTTAGNTGRIDKILYRR